MFFDHYPYTNFHNVNLDWVLQAVKAWGRTVEANDQAFKDLAEANEDFKRYVTKYLQDLDITDEINTKLDAMLASGVLTPYFAPYVKGYVDSWLASHVTPTSPALDSTLTLSGAAARADSTGKRLKDLAYIDALSTPEVIAALNRSQVLPGYRVQGITYDYDGHYYVCGGSVDETGTGVIVKMTKPDFTDAEITEIPQLGHANDITYYNGYLYVCTVGGGDAPRWGIYKINVNDFTDKTLISNAPENTIGISYRQGDFWILAPYRIYRTTDFTSYEVVVANTNDLLTAYGIPTSGRISQTIFRAAGYLIGWVCSFVFEDRHYGALTFFSASGEPIAFKMFPAYHTEIQGAVYADMSIYLVADGNMVNVFRMDPRHLSYVQLKAGDDLNSFTGRGTLYSTGSNVSAALLNSPSAGEGFTVQVDRLGVYNTIQTARTNSGRELYRIKSFNTDTWGEWIEPAAEVSQIKDTANLLKVKVSEQLLTYNVFGALKYSQKTGGGSSGAVTYTYSDGKWSAVGTANGTSFCAIFNDGGNSTPFPDGVKPGDGIYVICETTDSNFYVEFRTFDGSGKDTQFATAAKSKYITVPSDSQGIWVRLRVTSGATVDATMNCDVIVSTVNDALYELKPGDDMLSHYGTFTDREHLGVTFDWTGRKCHVSGTADGGDAFVNLFNSTLPYGVSPGDLFRVRYESTSTRIGVKVNFYDASGSLLSITADSKDFEFVVPRNAKTMFIRVYVVNGVTIDAMLTRLQVIKMNKMTMDIPLIVSFVDDDTTANDYVTKYHDACCHNGVKGNYAVITKNIEQQWTSADKLLEYEDDGFGTLIHCYVQTYEGDSPWNPQSGIRTGAQTNECRANLAKGLRQMRDLGFVNYDYWITPGGHRENDLKDMTKQLGLKCLISTNNGRENNMTDYDKCYIKRVSFGHDDTYAASSMSGIKSLIDDVVSRGKGWLIITTHFNTGWSGLTWDTTLDANGYPVGYSRFNEMVQYAISKGLVPMSLPQAWEYYSPILENNRDLCNMAN